MPFCSFVGCKSVEHAHIVSMKRFLVSTKMCVSVPPLHAKKKTKHTILKNLLSLYFLLIYRLMKIPLYYKDGKKNFIGTGYFIYVVTNLFL